MIALILTTAPRGEPTYLVAEHRKSGSHPLCLTAILPQATSRMHNPNAPLCVASSWADSMWRKVWCGCSVSQELTNDSHDSKLPLSLYTELFFLVSTLVEVTLLLLAPE